MNYSRNVKLLGWHSFFIGLSPWAPIAILFFSKVSGSYALGLSIFSIVMVSSAIFEVPTGIFSDYIGRRKTLILGSLFYALGTIAYALSHNYLLLVIGALMEGLGRSFYSGNNDAFLFESVEKSDDKRSLEHFLGKVGSVEQWALALSAVVGSLIASWSFRVSIWLSVIPLLVCLLLSIFTCDIEINGVSSNIFVHLKEAIKLFVKNQKLRWLSIGSILGFGMGEAAFQFRSAFVSLLWPVWAIGFSQVLSNIGAAISFRLADKLIKKASSEAWLFWGNIYSRASNLVALAFPGIASPALMASTSIFYGVGGVAKTALMQKNFSKEQRATMGSLNSLGGSICFGVFAVIMGATADLIGPARAMIMGQLAQLSCTYIYWKIWRESRLFPATV